MAAQPPDVSLTLEPEVAPSLLGVLFLCAWLVPAAAGLLAAAGVVPTELAGQVGASGLLATLGLTAWLAV